MTIPAINEKLAAARQYHESGWISDAQGLYREILALQPDHPEALHLLGIASHQNGENESAIEYIRKAIVANPKVHDYHSNLGTVLHAMGRSEEAVTAYRQALMLKPDSAESHFNLANTLSGLGRFEESLVAYREALRLQPGFADAWYNFGCALNRLDRFDEAIEAYRRAISIKPDFPLAFYNLGSALQEIGNLDDALKAFRRAMELSPAERCYHDNLVYALHFHPAYDSRSIFEEARRWNQQHARPLGMHIRPHDNTRDPERRLRIGYVSPDLRAHVVGWNLWPAFREHDHSRFEIFCYSGSPNADSFTERFRSRSDHWRDISDLGDERAAEMIRADRIDILIDLSLHMAGNRLSLFARKPAPVQMSYLGYCSTTGLDTIDYRLSDPYLDPLNLDLSCYSEKTLRLSRSYWCYEPGQDAPEPAPPPVLQSGFITFGCRNSFSKVSPAALELWARVMNAVPSVAGKALQSRLILHAHPGSHRQDALDRMGRAGIAPDRIEFVGWQSWSDYIRTFARIDIALDPIPYVGWITTCDTLWMGVPVITLSGRTAAGRGGTSILSNIGLPELIARDPDDYVAIARDLAANPRRLSELRQSLRSRMQSSPLMNAPQIARDLESLYRQAWREWCVRPIAKPKSSPTPPPATSVQQTFSTALQNHQRGRWAEAEALYRQVLGLQPRHADAALNLGVVLKAQGRFDDALAAYREALAIKPDGADAHFNLGNLLLLMSRFDEAVSACRQAISLRPAFAAAYDSLGNALIRLNRREEAVDAYRSALTLKPDFVGAYSNLAAALRELGQTDEAESACRRALALQPDYGAAHGNLGMILKEKGRIDEALKAFRAAADLFPDNPAVHSNFIFHLHYSPAYDAQAILRECRLWNERHGRPLRPFIRPHPNDRNPDRRLRIGYVSPDFRGHAVGWNILPAFSRHDRDQFEIFCYSSGAQADAFTARLQSHADHWRDIANAGDAHAAEMIRTDQIDILVDLALHTGGNRLPLFARKPAPIQVTYLGYCSTTGLETMDYRLSDPYLDPWSADLSCYTEQTLRLPNSYWCYQPGGDTPEPTPPPLSQASQFTFGCLNTFSKDSFAALDLWARLMQVVPPGQGTRGKSRLIIHALPGSHRQNVLDRMSRLGIAPERIEFVGWQPWTDYVQTFARIDIALDPFPYGGGISTCDALYMGVPVVTLAGQTAVGRGGKSILSNIGLPDLVARDPDAYIAIASALAADPQRLAELRHTLRTRMKASPLMDAPQFARDLESQFRQVWRKWCSAAGAVLE